MKSGYIEKGDFLRIISTMPYDHQTVLLLCVETGLRLSDVLGLTYLQAFGEKPVIERKTGKTCTLDLPSSARMVLLSRQIYLGAADADLVFPGAKAGKSIHRTTIYRSLKKAAAGFRANVTPHTARKVFAVELFRKTGDIELVRNSLRHDYQSTSLLYAFADKLQHFSD